MVYQTFAEVAELVVIALFALRKVSKLLFKLIYIFTLPM